MNELLRSILTAGFVVTEEEITRPLLHFHISEEEGNFIQELIRKARPEISLEVGCAYGISSLYICEALREVGAKKHVIIDPNQHAPHGGPFSGWEGVGLANLRRGGYADLVDFHEVPSYQCLSRFTEEGLKCDFAFIDGAHTFDYVLVDFFLIDKLLKPGGIVVLDDLPYPSIRDVCRFVLLNLRYKCIGPQSREPSSWRKLVSHVSDVPLLRRVLSPKIVIPDWELNIPNSRYVALQKLEDNLVDEGPGSTRRSTDHTRF